MPGTEFQTQTAYRNSYYNEYVFSHCFESQIYPQSFNSWPKGIIKIWALNPDNKLNVQAFGSFYIPFAPGYHCIEINCWSPLNNLNDSNLNSFNKNNGFEFDSLPDKESLTVKSSGTVFIDLNLIFRNMQQSNYKY